MALICGTWLANHFEGRFIASFAKTPSAVKVQGMAVARAAFRNPALLPTYGSSAVGLEWENGPINFFREHPRGFHVFPIAKPGAPLLVILQRLAAIGASLEHKKVALIVSPEFFEHISDRVHFYSGNFSSIQAFEIAYGVVVPRDLASHAARRLLEFPATLTGQPLLRFGLARLGGNRIVDSLAYGLSWPLGRAIVTTNRLQDHAEAMLSLRSEGLDETRPGPAASVDYNALAEAWRPHTPPLPMTQEAEKPPGSSDEWYLERLSQSRSWEDFEILINTLHALGAREVVVSLPSRRAYWSHVGVSVPYQEAYYKWLAATASRCGANLAPLHHFDQDPRFYQDQQEHPSSYGWVFGNQALDTFFHSAP